MKKVYKTVLIDADNTLLDFNAAEVQALRRTVEARGLAFAPELLEQYIAINRAYWDAKHRGQAEGKMPSWERFRRFGLAIGCPADPEAWDLEYLEALGDCGDMLPGALELLAQLKGHCRIGLATNGLKLVQRKRLRDHPMLPYLDGIFISEEMGVGKPHKAYFDAVLKALSATPETTVMVGDDLLSDIQGAVNAGLDSIWYSPLGGESPLPTYRVERLDQVADIVLGR